MQKISISLIVILLFGCLASDVLAAGFKVYPSQINLDLEKNESSLQKLMIENNSIESLAFEVKTERGGEWIKISQPSFILTSQQKKEVDILINIKRAEVFTDNLLVVAKQPSQTNSLTANIGVKIPIQVTIKPQPLENLSANLVSFLDKQIKLKYLVYALIAILLLSLAFWLKKMKRL